MEIVVENLHKRFGENHVLRGVELRIAKGSVTFILGGSGAGKSVLLKHIVGLLRPDEGKIFLDGTEITRLAESQLLKLRQRIALIFQTGGLLNSLSVGENVALGLKEHRLLAPAEIKKVVSEKLALLDLAGKEAVMPAELSEGMKKRVSLARALTLNPQLVLYDEPTAGLDPPMAENIDHLIHDLDKRLGVTSVVVSHDLLSAFRVADYICMLHQGRIVEQGSREQFRQSQHPEVKRFLARGGF